MPFVVDAVERAHLICSSILLHLLLIIWLLIQHNHLLATSFERRINRGIVPPDMSMLAWHFHAFSKRQILVPEMSLFREIASVSFFIVVLVCGLFHGEEIQPFDSTDVKLSR